MSVLAVFIQVVSGKSNVWRILFTSHENIRKTLWKTSEWRCILSTIDSLLIINQNKWRRSNRTAHYYRRANENETVHYLIRKNVIVENVLSHSKPLHKMLQTIIGHCFKWNSSIITIVHHKMTHILNERTHIHWKKPQPFGIIPIETEREQNSFLCKHLQLVGWFHFAVCAFSSRLFNQSFVMHSLVFGAFLANARFRSFAHDRLKTVVSCAADPRVEFGCIFRLGDKFSEPISLRTSINWIKFFSDIPKHCGLNATVWFLILINATTQIINSSTKNVRNINKLILEFYITQ